MMLPTCSRRIAARLALSLCLLAPGLARAATVLTNAVPLDDAGSEHISLTSQTPGATQFISLFNVHISDPSLVTSIKFTILPKPGSFVRPLMATYSAAYLTSRGYMTAGSQQVTVPVFGLFANYANQVRLNYYFADGSSIQRGVTVNTPAFTDSCNVFNNRTVVTQARTSRSDLSYDYFLLKKFCDSELPYVVDTDSEIRWVGPGGYSNLSAIWVNNGFIISNGQLSTRTGSGIVRMELDGTYHQIADYSAQGVVFSGHHQYDPGKTGILVEVDTSSQTESTILEVDPTTGAVIKTFSMSQIISDAMTAGGDDPTKFVYPSPNDWFHNNAATYRASDNTLIVSSRENFLIAIDYDTQQIKWILGDTTKYWYQQFPSLRAFALTMAAGSLPPIGQHAVSITANDEVMVFDNGHNSLFSGFKSQPGIDRGWSSPRRYKIDKLHKIATETWNYEMGQTNYSPICSSVYADQPKSYLIDYAVGGNFSFMELVGLNSTGKKVFDYKYPYGPSFCSSGWNAHEIHLENLQF